MRPLPPDALIMYRMSSHQEFKKKEEERQKFSPGRFNREALVMVATPSPLPEPGALCACFVIAFVAAIDDALVLPSLWPYMQVARVRG